MEHDFRSGMFPFRTGREEWDSLAGCEHGNASFKSCKKNMQEMEKSGFSGFLHGVYQKRLQDFPDTRIVQNGSAAHDIHVLMGQLGAIAAKWIHFPSNMARRSFQLEYPFLGTITVEAVRDRDKIVLRLLCAQYAKHLFRKKLSDLGRTVTAAVGVHTRIEICDDNSSQS